MTQSCLAVGFRWTHSDLPGAKGRACPHICAVGKGGMGSRLGRELIRVGMSLAHRGEQAGGRVPGMNGERVAEIAAAHRVAEVRAAKLRWARDQAIRAMVAGGATEREAAAAAGLAPSLVHRLVSRR